ncbi:MAG: FAD:protein FMN transferase [Gammaproteobacteria bacterium]
MRRLIALTVALACAAPACTRPTPPDSDRFPALGTLVEVTVRESDDGRRVAALQRARTVFESATRDWHGWGGGELARVNDGTATPSAELAALITRADEIASASGGLFEPRLGTLVELWGFHDGERAPGPPPDDVEIATSLESRVRIDLGAVAKGAAVAAAIDALRAAGITDALVDAGGDLAALGDAGGRPWRVGVRDPHGLGVIAGLDLRTGEAVFTSGDYERRFEWNGIAYHHLFDPRTGHPARATASVTVVHRDPATADAASTALFVAGDDWPRVARELGIDFVMRVTPDGRIETTAAFARRASLPDGVATR